MNRIHQILSLLGILFFMLLIGCQVENQPSTISKKIDLSKHAYFEENLPFHFRHEQLQITAKDSSVLLSNEIAALGRVLFYETRLSQNNSISCASCHQPSKSFCDGDKLSQGLFNKQTTHNSMALINTGFQKRFFWDINGDSLRGDVMKPILNHLEMGIESLEDLPPKLQQYPMYEALFQEAFGKNDAAITSDKISLALSQFVSALYSYRSKFDEGHVSNFVNYTQKELHGKDLFFGKAKCATCHQYPLFTRAWGSATNIGLDSDFESNPIKQFKIPTLRNIELTSPYMHDGRFTTLEEVVDHYNEGIQFNTFLAWEFKDPNNREKPIQLHLSETEKKELIAFLKTLTDWTFLTEERFSNPF